MKTGPGQESKDLGTALLIAEAEDGRYEPVQLVSTVREAREIAVSDWMRRRRDTEAGRDVLCPAGYKLWGRTYDGSFEVLTELAVF